MGQWDWRDSGTELCQGTRGMSLGESALSMGHWTGCVVVYTSPLQYLGYPIWDKVYFEGKLGHPSKPVVEFDL